MTVSYAPVFGVVIKIGELLVQQAIYLSGVSDKVDLLQTELRVMTQFIMDEDARQLEAEGVSQWVAELRDVGYDAEDIIEKYVLKVASRRGGGVQKVMKRYTCILGEAFSVYMFGLDIVKIMRKFSHLRSMLQNRKIKSSGSQQSEITRPELQHEVLESKDDVDKLVTFLLNEDSRYAFICGMSGMGKTTLAKMVYKHSRIVGEFPHHRAWIYLSQQSKSREVWQEILFTLRPPTSLDERKEILKLTDSELITKLHQVQRDNKCLVILDNIQNSKQWTSLIAAFPWRNSKILLTSCNKDLLSEVRTNCLVHELQCLDDRKSWELFQMIRMARRQDSITSTDEMENLEKEMVKECGGFPLAIQILAAKTLVEGQELVGPVPKEENSQAIKVFASSYYDLPYYLKQCFLYFGHYPEGFEIPAKELIQMWMAEGFISEIQFEREGENTMEMAGEQFLKELVQRCMIQIGKTDSLGKIKTCRIHDFMLYFCVSKAREENFLQIMSIPSLKKRIPTLGKIQRIAIKGEQHNFDPSLPLMISKKYPCLRSLLYFCPDSLDHFYLVKSMFKNFKSLRVLNLKKSRFHNRKLPKDIECLIHLRFLSLKNSNIYNVPSSIGNLRCLQTLDLRYCTEDLRVPNVFKKMENLRHLYLPIDYRVSEKLELANLHYLQTLVNVDLNKCDLKQTFPSLRVLVIGTYPYNKETTDIISMVSSCPLLYKLNLKSKIQKLPEDKKICQHIAKLTLQFTFLQEDPMAILGKLLKLKILRLLLKSFEGKQMTCTKKGFPQLRSLVLRDLTNLNGWTVEEEAMKSLSHLEIAYCETLMMIPDGLRFVTTLQELEIRNMPKSFKDRYSEGGREFGKVEHVRSRKFHRCDEE